MCKKMNYLFYLLLILFAIIVANIRPIFGHNLLSSENGIETAKIEKIAQKCDGFSLETDESCDAACTKQLKALIVPMLLEECQMVQSIGQVPENAAINLDEEIKGEVERNCAAIKNGKQLAIGTPELADKVGLALREYGQTMMAILEEEEKRTEITMDGMHGTMVDLLARANNPREQIRSQKLQRIVAMGNTLGALGAKMSAGPAKDAVQSLLLLSSDHSRHTTGPQPMELVLRPSHIIRLVIQLWHTLFPFIVDGGSNAIAVVNDQERQWHGRHSRQKRRDRRRRKRQNSSFNLFDFLMLCLSAYLGSYLVAFMKEMLENVGDLLEFTVLRWLLALVLFAIIRQQPIFRKIAIVAVRIADRIRN